jgi:hypothetical protein
VILRSEPCLTPTILKTLEDPLGGIKVGALQIAAPLHFPVAVSDYKHLPLGGGNSGGDLPDNSVEPGHVRIPLDELGDAAGGRRSRAPGEKTGINAEQVLRRRLFEQAADRAAGDT